MYQELSDRIKGGYIEKNVSPITKKNQLYELLKMWCEITEEPNDTIGDLDIHNKNSPIITLNIDNCSFYINADTKRKGVKQFLSNIDRDWHIIKNNRGKLNKVTNDPEYEPIEGFYMYKK